MNTLLLVAAGISAVGGVLHSILGERLILSRLAIAGLPETLGSPVFAARNGYHEDTPGSCQISSAKR